MTQKTETIEVPAALKECLLSLVEIREKIQDYCPKSDVSDCLESYAGKFDDLIGNAAYQIGDMIRVEVLNNYYYKDK